MTFLRIAGIRKLFGTVVALDGVDLEVAQGSRTAIVGPSGSGKTTLLRIIAGFEAPDQGVVALGERLLADGPRIMPPHQRGIGIVAQDGALFPHLSVEHNIGFGLPRGNNGRDRRIAAAMEMVELDHSMLKRRPDELSGGQQQRVALARALATEPQLMLLDEPFSALDTGLRASTRKAVSGMLAAAGITTILVTHDQAEALSFADQVAVMREGLMPQVGTPRQLYFEPRDQMVAEFMGDCLVLDALVADGAASCCLGRVLVQDGAAAGPARIMLRPEQIVLEAVSPEAAITGTVVEVDFGGAVNEVILYLASGGSAPERIAVRRSGLANVAAGDVVAVGVSGRAQVLAS